LRVWEALSRAIQTRHGGRRDPVHIPDLWDLYPRWTSALAGGTITIRGDVKMDTQQIVEAFRRLPVHERARLVEDLWDEVAHELEQRPLREAERRLLDERIRQHNESPTDVEAWETARDDILRDL
jgi:putative addiction module component (TIGR02574 family)